MLHLDRNHTSPLSPHTKPNLILSDTPQADQPALLSWAVPPTDDGSFAFDGKDQSQPDSQPSPPKTQPELSDPEQPQQHDQHDLEQPPPHDSDTTDPPPPPPPPPLAPADADEPKPDPVPSSPVDPTSPALESTSSLTPPPDSTSPAFPSAALPDQEPSTLPKLEQPDGEQLSKTDDKSAEVDKASRASTPLSELSSAPDGDDPPDAEKRDEKGDPPLPAEGSHEGGGSKTGAEAAGLEPKVEDDAKPKNGHVDPPQSSSNSTLPPDLKQRQGSHDVVPKAESLSDADSQAHHLSTPEPVSTSSRNPSKLDPRVVAVLELNAHLLKVSIEFQNRNVPLADPVYQQYTQRLQSNLAWLAATADATRKLNHNNMPFPVMQAPPNVDFVAMERIVQLYTELPTLFAKDIMRRQALLGAAASHIPGGANGHLKRDRPDEPPGEISNKRRDTGESKLPTPGPGTPSHHSPTHAVVNSMVNPATPPHNGPLQGMPGSSMGSPSMPPPVMNPNALSNEAQAQAQALMAQRAARMRASMQEGGRPAQPMGPSGQSGMPMQNMAGPSGMPNPQQGMGQGMNNETIMQSLQILQNPSHPWTRYLINHNPNFPSLPMQTQLQHLQKLQIFMATQARNKANAQQQGNPMQGFPQGQQNGMPGQMGLPNGSPTRLSQQQSPMPPQAGLGGGNVPLDPQRRQLLLMQQQNMMRSNAMFNNQQQQQRLAQQAGGPQHMGSPMLGGDGVSFPALRSNPSVPGIARSTRTPSDHAPSPLTPQLSGGAQDLQRAMMAQQGQRGMNPNMLHGQNHGMGQMAQMGLAGLNAGWPQSQQQQQQQMPGPHGQSYGMTPPGSAGFGSMPGGGSPVGGGGGQQQQWPQGVQGGPSFAFNAGSPSGQPTPEGLNQGPGSRQTSATPAPHQQMVQNNPMGDQAGLNVDFNEMFTWGP